MKKHSILILLERVTRMKSSPVSYDLGQADVRENSEKTLHLNLAGTRNTDEEFTGVVRSWASRLLWFLCLQKVIPLKWLEQVT